MQNPGRKKIFPSKWPRHRVDVHHKGSVVSRSRLAFGGRKDGDWGEPTQLRLCHHVIRKPQHKRQEKSHPGGGRPSDQQPWPEMAQGHRWGMFLLLWGEFG